MAVKVTLWTVDLTREAGAASLSADERARAERLVIPAARRRFTTTRVRLREVLAGSTGIEPRALVFGAGEYGKPYLQDIPDAPHFSVSHSEDTALIALSQHPVGVDIERVRPLSALAQMADIAFTDAERTALWDQPDAARLTAFFRLWTRKEAVTKAHGAGFRLIKSFSLTSNEEDGTWMQLNGAGYTVRSVDCAAGFAAAVAVLDPSGEGLDVVSAAF